MLLIRWQLSVKGRHFGKMKRFRVWIIGVIILLVVVTGVVTAFERFVFFNSFDADHSKYVDKVDALTKPEEYVLTMEEPEKISAILQLRTLLSNNRAEGDFGPVGILTGLNFCFDFAYAFTTEGEDRILSKGCYIAVYDGSKEDKSVISNNIGIMSVDELIGYDFASELYELVKNNPDCKVRLDEYAINGYIVIPVALTVDGLSDLGTVAFYNDEIPKGYEKVTASNIYVSNDCEGSIPLDADKSLYQKMKAAYNHDCKAQKLCDRLVSEIDYSAGDNFSSSLNAGFGKISRYYVAVKGNNAMVSVICMDYTKTIVTDIIIAILIWTFIFVMVHMTNVMYKKNKK